MLFFLCIHHLIGMYIGKLADDACVFQIKMLSNRNIFIVETQVKPGKCLEKLVKGNLRNIDQKLEYYLVYVPKLIAHSCTKVRSVRF